MDNHKNLIDVEGIIVRVKEGLVEMDLKGRLGNLTVPKRMIISDETLEVGQEVTFKMSFPSVTKEERSKVETYKKFKL